MKKSSFVAAILGVIAQYYDYYLYGFLAAAISKHFFPGTDNVVQLMKAYLVITLGVLAKPVGAIVLGRIGDIYGRSQTLTFSLIGTAIPALVIAIVPGYDKISIVAAWILLICRMCIAACVSSGTDGVRIFIYEKIGKKNQCLGMGLITAATQVGIFIAAMSAWFFTLDFLPDYSWRFAFALGAAMGFGVLFIRSKICTDDDNIDYSGDKEYHTYKDSHILSILKQHFSLFLLCGMLAGCIAGSYQFHIVFLGTYMFDILKLVEQSDMQFYTGCAIVFYMVFAIIAGKLADMVGKQKVAVVAGIVVMILTVINVIAVSQNTVYISVYFMAAMALPFVSMPALALLKQSIPKVIRYRIFSLAHALGSITISATTAFFSTYIYHQTKIAWLPLIYFLLMMFSMIMIINALSRRSALGGGTAIKD